jgi:hypothetical protein
VQNSQSRGIKNTKCAASRDMSEQKSQSVVSIQTERRLSNNKKGLVGRKRSSEQEKIQSVRKEPVSKNRSSKKRSSQ